MRSFVLQALDAELGHAVVEARLDVVDPEVLRRILSCEPGDDLDLQASYELDCRDLAVIKAELGVALETDGRPALLVPWSSTRDAPYLVHTGYELPLMLDGRKPFSKFSDFEHSEWLAEVLCRFKRFVDEGRIVARTVRRSLDDSRSRAICEAYFALPGQEWRIDAYLLLVEVGLRVGWNHTLERYEGRLLGYEEWQNDWHIDRLLSRAPGALGAEKSDLAAFAETRLAVTPATSASKGLV